MRSSKWAPLSHISTSTPAPNKHIANAHTHTCIRHDMCASSVFYSIFSFNAMLNMFTFGTNYTNTFRFITFNGKFSILIFAIFPWPLLVYGFFFRFIRWTSIIVSPRKTIWADRWREQDSVQEGERAGEWKRATACWDIAQNIKINVFIVSLSPNLMQWK